MAERWRRREESKVAWPPIHSAWERHCKAIPWFWTSAPAWSRKAKCDVLFNKGQKTPDGWLLDNQGKPTNDPSVLYKEPPGTILPLGGTQAYKGFGISLLLDMFTGGLSGAPCSTPGAPNLTANAVVFIVLDVNQFAGGEHFLREVTNLAANVRACPKANTEQEITLPGDPERREKVKRLRDGITLDERTWGQLVDLAGGLNVKVPAG